MEESLASSQNQLSTFLMSLIVALFTSLVAYNLGFFRLSEKKCMMERAPNGIQVAQVFIILLAIQTLFVPAGFYLWVFIKYGVLTTPYKVSLDQQGWVNVISILAAFIGIFAFCFVQDQKTLHEIWGGSQSQEKERHFFNFLFGALSWIVIYPMIGIVGQLVGFLIAPFYEGPHLDQLAVKHLKNILDNTWLFRLSVVEIIIIVPVLEELLFRGYLQSWLTSFLGITKGVLLTSATFALFHFSPTQGIDNIELIASLFVLSCFLGFVKERQGSLWASIGLHSTFNAISVALIIGL